MAGGWGAPVNMPMMLPPQPPSAFMMGEPEKPSVKTVQAAYIAKPAKPGMTQDFLMSSGRQQEAAEYAAAMGNAFRETRMQNKHQKAKARARNRAAQAAAEKRKRR